MKEFRITEQQLMALAQFLKTQPIESALDLFFMVKEVSQKEIKEPPSADCATA